MKQRERNDAGSASEGYPTPRCFLQEWQTKELGLTRRVRVANAGLKVALFSWSCGLSVRVADKGVADAVEKTKFEIGNSKIGVEVRTPPV